MGKLASREDETQEIVKLLEKMQEGYTKRAVDEVDAYAKALFVQGDEMVILGTSDGEWCMGYEKSKGILEGDWKYWGNVVINTEDVDIAIKDNVAWFNTEGSVEYSFKSDDETCDRYLNFVKEDLGEKSWLGPLSEESKLTTVALTLAHFMLEGKAERKYQWKIRLSGVAIKKEEGWRFTQLQFSLPTTSLYPDERIWEGNVYGKAHQRDLEKLKEFSEGKRNNTTEEIQALLAKFNQDYLQNQITSVKFIEEYFSTQGDERIVGTATDQYKDSEELVKAIDHYRNQWQGLDLATNEAVISVKDDTAWVLALGEAKRIIPYEEAIKREMEEANKIIESELTSREKLFKIRRNLATMFNEASKGEEYVWPLRWEAVLTKQEGRWLFHSMQFSYPFNMILEGKTDAAIVKSI